MPTSAERRAERRSGRSQHARDEKFVWGESHTPEVLLLRHHAVAGGEAAQTHVYLTRAAAVSQ